MVFCMVLFPFNLSLQEGCKHSAAAVGEEAQELQAVALLQGQSQSVVLVAGARASSDSREVSEMAKLLLFPVWSIVV